ncbi:MAG: CDP-alcohol phosphatidyltransferase family protein [Pseudomonadota bacterium]
MKASNIPNLLTAFRIVLVAPLVLSLVRGRYDLAVALFFLAGFTDVLDGFLARSMNWHTRLGALLDPAADKLMMFCTFVTLASIKLVPLWLAGLVIARDLLIIGGTLGYRVFVGPFVGQATTISKLNTGLQLLFVLCVMAGAAFALPPAAVTVAIGAAMVLTTVISGIDYVRIGVNKARLDKGEAAHGG